MRLGAPTLLPAALLAALLAAPAAAQEGTPGPADGRTVSPEECVVEPRTAEEVLALVGLDAGTPAPEPPPAALTAPLGEPASGAVATELEGTARELVACLNAGDELRAAALFTDAGVRRFVLGEEDADPAALEAALAAAPEPLPEERRLRLLAVTDAAVRPDRRAAAFVVIDPPTREAEPLTFFAAFAREGGRWRLEGLFGLSRLAPAGTPDATPAP
jgi:hypothetical protein